MPDLERLLWTRAVLVVGLGWGLLHFQAMWQAERICPRAPVSPRLPQLRHEPALFRMLLLLLAVIGLSAKPLAATLALAVLVGISCLTDWTRCRPMLYQGVAMLLFLALLPADEALSICRLIPVSIYLWSGLLKANTAFLAHIYPWFVEPLSRKLPGGRSLKCLGPGVPVLEAALGLGLLFPSTRLASLVAITGMHGFILLAFSPLGHRTHGEVWPWNLSMAAANWTLFWSTSQVNALDILIGERAHFAHLSALLLFGVLPVLGLKNSIDPVFSHAHMAGRHTFSALVLSPNLRARLPESVQRYCLRGEIGGLYTLDLVSWYLSELQVPPPQTSFALKAIARDFARYNAGEYDLQLTTYEFRGVVRMLGYQRTYTWTELTAA